MGKNSPLDDQPDNASFPKIMLGHANNAAKRPFSNIFLMLCAIAYFIWLLLLPKDAIKSLLTAMAWVSVGFAGFRLGSSCRSFMKFKWSSN